jgi:monoamine oxidase
MKRRTALRNIGLGLTAGLALPTWLSSCHTEEPGPEIEFDGTIAIIGAGAAGLYVADILQARGLKVVIYEASDRLGGRIRSIRQFEENPLSNAYPVELGAERVLGGDSLWAKMVKQLERPYVEFPLLSTDRYFLDGVYKTKAEAETDPDFIAGMNFFNNFKNYSGSNVSVQDAIQSAGLSPRVYGILNSLLGNKYGTTNSKIGATALSQGLSLITRNSSELRLSVNPMQDVLSTRFSAAAPNIKYNHVVKSINYIGDKILIEGESLSEAFSSEVDRVIVTVPVSILKDGDITFSPSLPSEKTAALSRMGMDAALRLVLEFKQNFWGVDSAFLYGATQIPEYFNAGAGENSTQYSKVLSMSVMGSKAEELSPLGLDAIQVILAELDSFFEGKATVNIRRDLETDEILSVLHDWTTSPYIRGGVSYVKPGGTNDDRITLGEPVGGKLFFAGEATDGNGEFGTINGALLSAERVAQEVVDTTVA